VETLVRTTTTMVARETTIAIMAAMVVGSIPGAKLANIRGTRRVIVGHRFNADFRIEKQGPTNSASTSSSNTHH
jgi:hypothetical protein